VFFADSQTLYIQQYHSVIGSNEKIWNAADTELHKEEDQKEEIEKMKEEMEELEEMEGFEEEEEAENPPPLPAKDYFKETQDTMEEVFQFYSFSGNIARYLKGQCHEIFGLRFFVNRLPLGPRLTP
jgi:hypothetical protein